LEGQKHNCVISTIWQSFNSKGKWAMIVQTSDHLEPMAGVFEMPELDFWKTWRDQIWHWNMGPFCQLHWFSRTLQLLWRTLKPLSTHTKENAEGIMYDLWHAKNHEGGNLTCDTNHSFIHSIHGHCLNNYKKISSNIRSWKFKTK
jgi:hypothetical protein